MRLQSFEGLTVLEDLLEGGLFIADMLLLAAGRRPQFVPT